MYLEHFGLTESPFSIAPDPRYLYMSERHREALAHLIYGLNSDGAFILLTGDVGTGKTTVSRCLLEQIPENTNLALVLNPKVSVIELLQTICDELRIQYDDGEDSVKTYVDYINRFLLGSHAQGKKTVVLIEEAQNLDLDVLEQLRLLTNLETNERKLLQIILLGQPELQDVLAKPELSQLAQRITARYHLKPLNEKELTYYLGHRLSVAGCRQILFPLPVVRYLYQLTGGIPRLINVLCDRALLGCYVQNKSQVDKQTLANAAKEVFGEKHAPQKAGGQLSSSTWIKAAVAASVVAVLSTVIFFTQYNEDVAEEVAAVETEIPDTIEPIPVEKKVIVEVSEPKEPEIIWPDEIERLRTNSSAFKNLFSHWHLKYQPLDHGTPCFYAQTQALTCFHGEGSIKEVRELNRPAVIKLHDNNNQTYFATLTGLGNQIATIELAGKEQQWTVKQLKQYWQGEFTLLWRTPPGYLDSIRPGHKGEDVVWLAQKINQMDKKNKLPEVSVYQDQLVEKVREFQTNQGLVADGVVGVQTLIRINNVLGSDVPVLKNNG